MVNFKKVTLLVKVLLASVTVIAQYGSYPPSNPVELGKVVWLRDYDEALKQATLKSKPVFILFQEVPGCSNCTKFGSDVLSHPLIAEAIESYFVPLCIYNNHAGKDKMVLRKYNEPAWNNPVIRIINYSGKDICEREPDFRYISKTVGKIIEGIKLSGQQVPKYLLLLADEMKTKEQNSLETYYLSMYCFWSGEKEIAGIDGVITTEAGYMHGKEVVKVEFDKTQTTLDKIVLQAKNSDNANQVYGQIQKNSSVAVLPPGSYRKDAEDKYYLRNSSYKVIPMTDLQKSKVNRSLGLRKNPDEWLSPRQLKILSDKKIQFNAVDYRIEEIWY